jgi:hypothetical protein
MMARSSKGSINRPDRKAQDQILQIITFGLQRAAGPYKGPIGDLSRCGNMRGQCKALPQGLLSNAVERFARMIWPFVVGRANSPGCSQMRCFWPEVPKQGRPAYGL